LHIDPAWARNTLTLLPYYSWETGPNGGIDGGPLGFLTWTIPMLVGSLAYDIWTADFSTSKLPNPGGKAVTRMLVWGAVIMVIGYAVSCLNRWTPPNDTLPKTGIASWLVEPPFVPPSEPINFWTMSQKAGSISYLTFGAGFSLAVLALFVQVCDRWGFQLGLWRTLGSNALAAYIIHGMVDKFLEPYSPKDMPLAYALADFALFFGICYLFLRYLEKNKLFLRL
jgi:hypothetical protein